jgi:hypothetical protein
MFRPNIVCPMVRFGGNGLVELLAKKNAGKEGEKRKAA